MSNNNNSASKENDLIIISDSSSNSSRQSDDEEEDQEERGSREYPDEQEEQDDNNQDFHGVHMMNQQNQYKVSHNVVQVIDEVQHDNNGVEIQQIYQNYMRIPMEGNRQSQALDEDVKMRLSQQDIRDGNNTPNSPSYLLFAPEQLKNIQDKGNLFHERVEKQFIKTLEEFSPISRMEDSRGDMTAQIFDLSMMQSRDLKYNQQSNKNQGKPIKSNFSMQLHQINKESHTINYHSNPATNQIPPNLPPPSSQTRLSNQKSENKSQKLRERFEKYSNQMMNNINLQKGNNGIDGQNKNHTKSTQASISKTFNSIPAENKRVQTIKGSVKTSKVSTPVTSKNTLGENGNEQKRDKSSNTYSKPTLSSQRKFDHPKTERNTPSQKQYVHSNNNNNNNGENERQQNGQKKQHLQQSLQQQNQIKVERKISSSTTNTNARNSVQNMNSNTKQLAQNKFLLMSPQRNKYQSQNLQGNSAKVLNLFKQPAQTQQSSKNRNSEMFVENKQELEINQIQSQSPPQKKTNSNNNINSCNQNNLIGTSQRKYSDNMNDRSTKKSQSQDNVNINFTRTDSFGSQHSANKQQYRKMSQNCEQYNNNNNNIEDNKNKREDNGNINIQDIRQQYKDSFNNYFSSMKKQSHEYNNSQEFVDNQEDSNEEQRDGVFAINIYKTQQSHSKKQTKQNDDDNELNDIPQLYGINRSQSQHTINQDNIEDESNLGKNNSYNFMRRSYTQDNMLQHVKQQQQQQQQQQQELTLNQHSHLNEENEQNNQKYKIQDCVNTENSFTQKNNNNYYNNYKVQQRPSNPNVSPNNFNTYDINEQTENSNFTTYTNAANQISTFQSFKAVSSAKYIDQDEDEVLNHKLQLNENKISDNKSLENQQQQQAELKIYNISQQARKSDTVQGGDYKRTPSKMSPRVYNSIQFSTNTSNNNNNSNNNLITLGKQFSNNNNSNSNNQNNKNSSNYFSQGGNEKQIVSQRYSDSIDVRKKTDPNTNKSNANQCNMSLNQQNPICLYNLHKENTHNNNKNTTKNNPPFTQNQNYYSLKEAISTSQKRVNINNQNQQQKEQNSPPIRDSPIKLNGNGQSHSNLNNQQKQQQQQIPSQKSRQTTEQSTHNVPQSIQNIQHQGQKSQSTSSNDQQLQVQLQTPITQITNGQPQPSSSQQNTQINLVPTNQNSPQNSNNTNVQQSYTQNTQYSQQFQQKQAGRIVSQRDQIKKKEKYLRQSNDFKIQQEQDIIDKALHRKGSSGNFRGSYRDSDDIFKHKGVQAKSFQEISISKNNGFIGNVSLSDNQQSHSNELKTLQNFFKPGKEVAISNNKKSISQLNSQYSSSKTDRTGLESSYAQLSQSQQANKSIGYQSIRKSKNNPLSNDISNQHKQTSRVLESQASLQKTPKQHISSVQSVQSVQQQQQQQISYVEDTGFTELVTAHQQQQQQKQAIQIQKLLGKCFSTQSNESDYFTKGKNVNQKVNNSQKESIKQAQANTYDTNIDYILKHLKQSTKQAPPQIAKNQNSSFNLNNKSLNAYQQHQQLQQKSQQKHASNIGASAVNPTSSTANPSTSSTNAYNSLKDQLSKYHKQISEKIVKSPQSQKGEGEVLSLKEKEQLNLRILQVEQEIAKIQSQKNRFVNENNSLELQNEILKIQIGEHKLEDV